MRTGTRRLRTMETVLPMLSLDDMINLTYTTTMSRCRGCVNHCVLTINRFEGGRKIGPDRSFLPEAPEDRNEHQVP